MFKKIIATDTDLTGLVLRLFLAAVFFPHGAQKLLGWFGGIGLNGTIDSFATHLGIPAFLTVLVIFFESAGSVALAAGFMTRLMSLGIAIIMMVAIYLVHWQHGFFMNWFGQKQGEGFEFHLLALAMATTLITKGGGRWSIDGVLQKKWPHSK